MPAPARAATDTRWPQSTGSDAARPSRPALTVVVDTVAPSTPLGVFAFAAGGTNTVSWAMSTDSGTGVSGYQVQRDGTTVATVSGTVFSEQATAGAGYTVQALDVAGNASPVSLTATAGAPFAHGRRVATGDRPERTGEDGAPGAGGHLGAVALAADPAGRLHLRLERA